jgi:sulfur carrier protein ThiS adenylyltransferase
MTLSADPAHRDRDLRQRALVPPERLAACQAVVIGCGAIGRQVALQLAAVGVPRLLLFDHDTVEPMNLAPQGYRPDQLSLCNVDVTAGDCRTLNPQVQVIPRAERFRRATAREVTAGHHFSVIFACVDAIATRRLLWEALRHQAALFVDGRMSAEVIRVLAVAAPATDDSYARTLFAAEQAYAGSCTARATIHTASIAAGLKWLRRLPVDPDLTLNLLSVELTVPDRADPSMDRQRPPL